MDSLRQKFNHRLRQVWRPRRAEDDAQQQARWLAMQEDGEAVTAMCAQPGWTVVERILGQIQAEQDQVLHGLSATDQHRQIAAAQWCAVEAIKRAVRKTVADGLRAKAALEQRTRPVSTTQETAPASPEMEGVTR